MRCHAENLNKGLSHCNQDASASNPPCTTISFLPLILNPANEYENLNTVVLRPQHIAMSLEQEYNNTAVLKTQQIEMVTAL